MEETRLVPPNPTFQRSFAIRPAKPAELYVGRHGQFLYIGVNIDEVD